MRHILSHICFNKIDIIEQYKRSGPLLLFLLTILLSSSILAFSNSNMSKNKKPTDDAPFNFNTLQRPSPSSKSTASTSINPPSKSTSSPSKSTASPSKSTASSSKSIASLSKSTASTSKSTASPLIKRRKVQESPPSHHPSVGGKRPTQDQITPHKDDQYQYTNII